MREEILQLKIKELEDQLEYKNKLVFLLEESIPTEQSLRKEYVSDVSFFYAKIFKNKLQHFISQQLMELAQIGRSELMNNTLRANINCFRLLDDWCQTLSNEHFGDLEEARKNFKEDEKFIKNIKNEYVKN